jgi:HlyD family secretion protein
MAGTVSKLDVELGERVVGTSQMAGTEMMRIARLNQMEVEVEVNENEIVNVAMGDTAAIEVDSYPEQPFQGVVTEIANSARTTGAGTQEQVTSFPVKVRILDAHNLDSSVSGTATLQSEEVPIPVNGVAKFRPGMSATVDIFTETVYDVVAVPIQAVAVRDFNKLPSTDGEEQADSVIAETDEDAESDSAAPANAEVEDIRKVVFIVEDGLAVMREVETGISDDSHIEIRSGLDGGEMVIIGPYRAVSGTLNPGDRVEANDDGQAPPFVASRD